MALILSACGLTTTEQYARWLPTQRPIELRLDAAMDDVCVEAVDVALDYWRDNGVDYLAPTSGTVDGSREFGLVTVEQAELSPGEVGYTNRARLADMMLYARVRLDSCDPLTVAHELGHAIGLNHNPRSGTVMYFAIGSSGWELDDDEREWVK